MENKSSLLRLFGQISSWLRERLVIHAGTSRTKSQRVQLLIICSVIFLVALGIRLLHWQDSQTEMQREETMITDLARPYVQEVNRMRDDGSILFPVRPLDRQDARMILHPPGYSILMSLIREDWQSDSSFALLRWLQVVCDSAAAVMIFLIAAQFFATTLALIAGMLVAVSPHLAHYSLWLTPETFAIMPVLLAIYLIIHCMRRPRLWMMIAAGALVGISCWLRSNGLLLAPFLALTVFIVLEGKKRWRYPAALIASALIVISPITIRNWAAYHRFVPLSLGAGITMVEGIADYDGEGRFGMPPSDGIVKDKDAEWHNRPDYARNIWTPDGIDRDRARFSRGLSVIKSNPGWFLKVMAHRAASMLRSNDSFAPGPSFYSPFVPLVSAEPGFGHMLSSADESQPVWIKSPVEMMTQGTLVSETAQVALAEDEQRLRVTGDDSSFGDQFASAEIAVEKNTDYLLRIGVKVEQKPIASKITSEDRSITLAADLLTKQRYRTEKRADNKAKKKAKKKALREAASEQSPSVTIADDDKSDKARLRIIEMPFASGDRVDVRLVISNNGKSAARPAIQLGEASLFKLGATPHQWTRFVRSAVRGVQRNVYTTTHVLPLVAMGILLLALTRQWRVLVVLLAVPAYYMSVQSAFHTEYRYIVAIHYFLFALAAVALYVLGIMLGQSARRLSQAFSGRVNQ
ncbi:MAG: glycosyltransferase family 39 protein [Blastocatellia bacterium]